MFEKLTDAIPWVKYLFMDSDFLWVSAFPTLNNGALSVLSPFALKTHKPIHITMALQHLSVVASECFPFR